MTDLVAQKLMNPPCNAGDPGLILGLGITPEKGMATPPAASA